jgi:hypothetical protein
MMMMYNSSINHPASMNNKKSRSKTVRKSKGKTKIVSKSKVKSKAKTRNARATRNTRATRNARAKRTGGFDIVERIIKIINKYLKKYKTDDYSQSDVKTLATKLANGKKDFTKTDREIEEILNFYLEELDDVSGDEVEDKNILVLFDKDIDNSEKAYNCLFQNKCGSDDE